MTTRKKNIISVVLGAAMVLLIPLVIMQFSEEVNWSPGDFAAAFILLVGAGLAYELLAKRLQNKTHRYAAGATIATIVLLIWAELAVGIF